MRGGAGRGRDRSGQSACAAGPGGGQDPSGALRQLLAEFHVQAPHRTATPRPETHPRGAETRAWAIGAAASQQPWAGHRPDTGQTAAGRGAGRRPRPGHAADARGKDYTRDTMKPSQALRRAKEAGRGRAQGAVPPTRSPGTARATHGAEVGTRRSRAARAGRARGRLPDRIQRAINLKRRCFTGCNYTSKKPENWGAVGGASHFPGPDF